MFCPHSNINKLTIVNKVVLANSMPIPLWTSSPKFNILTFWPQKLSAIEPKQVASKIFLYSWTTSHNRKKAQSVSPSWYIMYSNVQSHQMHHESRWSKLEITNSSITNFLSKFYLGIPHPILQMIYYES